MDTEQAQLFYDVKPHVDLRSTPLDEQILLTSIKVKGEMSLGKQLLNRGEQVTVTIADEDGTIIASGVCEIQQPAFADVTIEKQVVGAERIHTAKVVDGIAA